MITIHDNFSLRKYNTFQIDVNAAKFIEITKPEELQYFIIHNLNNDSSALVLGGGSNILFTKDYDGLVIKPSIEFVDVLNGQDDEVLIEAGAGVVWDDFVEYCVEHEYYGLENLSLIPGTVGAAPVQNIGAYGAEAGDTIKSVKGFYLETGNEFELDHDECGFGYRKSIFKTKLKGKTVISSVVFRLSKKEKLNLDYGDIKNKLAEYGHTDIHSLRKAIVEIRKSKLPDPVETGNAGSFFKNPEIEESHFNTLKEQYPGIPGYKLASGLFKVPAGWLIDKAGWKGKSMGRAGVNPRQALVLVNLGGAKGTDILDLAAAIEQDINKKFGIRLEKEVNII
jgi:UDP-N-acetylmuramate dehydrogenase